MKRLVPAFLIKWAKAIHDKLIPGDSKVGVSGDLEISGDSSVGGDISVTGDAAITGDVTAASFLGDNAKPLYWHTIHFQRGGTADTSAYLILYGYLIIINNSPELITLSDFQTMLTTPGFVGVVINGKSGAADSDLSNANTQLLRIEQFSDENAKIVTRDPSTNEEIDTGRFTFTAGWNTFLDLGANKLN